MHEVDDSALVLERVLLALAAHVLEFDLETACQECRLAEALCQDRVVVLDRLEDLEVREERDRGAAAVCLRALRELGHRLAALVGLRPLEAVAPDRELELLGQRVDHRDADAVKATGHLVATAVTELAAGVENREH